MKTFWKSGKRAGEEASDESANRPMPELKDAGEAGAFPNLPGTDVVRVLNTATLVKLASGERLFHANDAADRLYILISGRIQIEHPSTSYSEQYQAGDWISDIDFDGQTTREVGATALEPATLLCIDKPTFDDYSEPLKTYLAQRMHRTNLERLRGLRERAAYLAGFNDGLRDAIFAFRTRIGVRFAESPGAHQLFAKIPALPVSTITLLNKMLDERTTQTEIVELVTMDQSLTSTLLKAINSPVYGLGNEITNVNQAIVLLGHNTVYQIIMSESMRKCLPSTPLFTEIHARSVEVSRIAFALAQILNTSKPAEAATLGILCEIGLVLTALLKQHNERFTVLFDDLEPAAMGAELLRSWNLPARICQSIYYQGYPEFALPERIPDDVRINVTLLYLARRCYHLLHRTDEQPSALFLDAYLAGLNQGRLDEKELLYGRVVPRLRTQMRQLPRSLAERLDA